MLTDAEVEEVATTPGQDEDLYESIEEAVMAWCLYVFASESYKPHHAAHWTLFASQGSDAGPASRSQEGMAALYAPRDLDMIAALGAVGYCQSELEYAEGPNVLCNMSKGRYVLEDTLIVREVARGPVMLAHALPSLSCYSPDSSISIA